MSNYLRRLGVFHTPLPSSVPQDATLTGYVINTNGLRPVTLYGDENFSARFSTVQKKEKILKIQKAFFIAWKLIFFLFLLAK